MQDLIARKRLRYGARTYEAGERFTARNAQDARLLIAVRRADPAPAQPAAAAATPAPDPAAKRRVYRRRDMVAASPRAPLTEAEIEMPRQAELIGESKRMPVDWPAGTPWPPEGT